MSTKEEILIALRESTEFVSGQELSQSLGVSRTAVWKGVQKLKEEGYAIEAVTNRGYRLENMDNRDILNQQELERYWNTKWVGHPLYYKKETGSTNDDIMALSDKGAANGTLVLSSCQHAGKGRRGRTWISPDVGNIYMSILLKPDLTADKAPQTTLVEALSVYEACEDLEHPDTVRFGIKWPNDIVVSVEGGPYRKIVGILTEMRMEETRIRDVTVGTGININMKDIPDEVKDTATSLCLALGHDVTRAPFIARCWEYFERDYEAFLEAGSLAPLKAAYEKGLVNIGREVLVLDPKGQYSGTAEGITDTGELKVLPDGEQGIRNVGNGEISVRGVMGYV